MDGIFDWEAKKVGHFKPCNQRDKRSNYDLQSTEVSSG